MTDSMKYRYIYIYIYVYIYLNRSIHLQQNADKYIDLSIYTYTDWP